MATFFARRYMRDRIPRTEVFVGAGILLLVGGIAAAFAFTARSDRNYLFTIRPENRLDSAVTRDLRVASGLFPTLLSGEWTVNRNNIAARTGRDLTAAVEDDPARTLLTDFAARCLYTATYANVTEPARTIAVRIADMQTPEAAMGILLAARPTNAQSLAVGRGGWRSSDRAAFWSGRYYTEILTGKAENNTPDSTDEFARGLAAVQLLYGGPFWADAVLPTENRTPDGFRYLHKSALGFDFLSRCFVADLADGTSTFAVEAGGTDAAKKLLARFDDVLKQQGQAARQPDPSSGPFLVGSPGANRHLAVFERDGFLYGAVGPDPAAALAAVKAINSRVYSGSVEHTIALAAAPQTSTDSFPALEGTDWTVPDNVRTFTPDNLYEKIDGRAPIYLQFGVTRLTFGSYRHARDTKAYIDVYWYDMGTAENAFGIYKTEAGDPEHRLKIGREGYAAGAGVFFWKGTKYVQVVAPTEDDLHAQGAMAVAKAVADSISDGQGRLWAEALLPPEGQVPDSFQYQAKDAFGLDWLRDVFSSDYKAGDQTYKLFIHRAGNDKIAALLHGKYAEFLSKYGKVVRQDRSPDGLLVIGDSGGMIDVVFTRGKYLGGVYGAKDSALAEQRASAFRKLLPLDPGDPNAKWEDAASQPPARESGSSEESYPASHPTSGTAGEQEG